jgi:DNA-binding CsgD family transcriptional regulator
MIYSKNITHLTEREKQVRALIIRGRTYKEAAAILGMRPRTIDNHIESIKVKYGVKSIVELVLSAYQISEFDPVAEPTDIRRPRAERFLTPTKLQDSTQ